MAKAKNPKSPSTKKLPNDSPVHLNMSFDEAIKKAVNTPIKKSKAKK